MPVTDTALLVAPVACGLAGEYQIGAPSLLEPGGLLQVNGLTKGQKQRHDHRSLHHSPGFVLPRASHRSQQQTNCAAQGCPMRCQSAVAPYRITAYTQFCYGSCRGSGLIRCPHLARCQRLGRGYDGRSIKRGLEGAQAGGCKLHSHHALRHLHINTHPLQAVSFSTAQR